MKVWIVALAAMIYVNEVEKWRWSTCMWLSGLLIDWLIDWWCSVISRLQQCTYPSSSPSHCLLPNITIADTMVSGEKEINLGAMTIINLWKEYEITRYRALFSSSLGCRLSYRMASFKHFKMWHGQFHFISIIDRPCPVVLVALCLRSAYKSS